MAKITLKLDIRTITGKKTKQLRREGVIPGNIFGNKIKSLAVQVKSTVFNSVYQQSGETQIVYLEVSGEKSERPALISNIQVDPLSDKITHIDFRQVDLSQKVTANIPVEIVGESPAVKELQASLITSLSEIEVEALPADLPEKVLVQIGNLSQIGDSIKVSDLNIDRTKIEVLDDPETIVVLVAGQQAEEVVPVAPVASDETAATPVTTTEEAKAEPAKEKKESAK